MDEKAPTHRRGCIQGILCALGGGGNSILSMGGVAANSSFGEHRRSSGLGGVLVDKAVLAKRYLDDVEKSIRIGATDRDTEIRKIAKATWEIYRAEFPERVAA